MLMRRVRASAFVIIYLEKGSIFCTALCIGYNPFRMQLSNGGFLFVTEEELQLIGAFVNS